MWCRKRIDIGWSDLAAGGLGALFLRDPSRQHEAIPKAWPAERSILACLSVRSGWDLLLREWNLPEGSEVLMSAMTIPDMTQIVKAHGLVPVPLELDPATAAPSPEILRRAITPRSQTVLIAHLFGNRVDLTPHIALAREHNLRFVEDCAQAYAGPEFTGHPEADVSMFSFGTIKTSTALGGGVLHIRDADLCRRLADRQAGYPLQDQGKYFRRVLKYAGLKLISTYPAFAAFVRLCRWLGIDRNRLLNQSVRGFEVTEGVERFRFQPSAALLGLLGRRLTHPSPRRLERQRQWGRRLLERLEPRVVCPGSGAAYHHFWVFPVLTDQPAKLMEFLAEAGFDSTQGESMHIIEKPADSPAVEPDLARDWLPRMVYVPLYPELTDRAIEQLADGLLRFFEEHPAGEIEASPMAAAGSASRKES